MAEIANWFFGIICIIVVGKLYYDKFKWDSSILKICRTVSDIEDTSNELLDILKNNSK
jgi:hypothetical protein